MKPLVSIIMVVYNSSEYLNEAIESVLNCKYTNIELLISDDQSTDNSWGIVSSYNDPRIIAVRNERNLGEYKNRNNTISRARGKYFIFVDGDDTLLEKGLDEAVLIMEDNPETAFGINRPKIEGIYQHQILSSEECYRRHYLHESPINYSFARNIFRTEIIKKNNLYIPSNIFSGDDFIRLRLSALYAIVLIPNPFAEWRKRPGQASQRKARTIEGLLEPYIINHYFLCQPNCPLTSLQKEAALKRIFKKVCWHMLLLLKNGQMRFAFSLLKILPVFTKFKTMYSPN